MHLHFVGSVTSSRLDPGNWVTHDVISG